MIYDLGVSRPEPQLIAQNPCYVRSDHNIIDHKMCVVIFRKSPLPHTLTAIRLYHIIGKMYTIFITTLFPRFSINRNNKHRSWYTTFTLVFTRMLHHCKDSVSISKRRLNEEITSAITLSSCKSLVVILKQQRLDSWSQLFLKRFRIQPSIFSSVLCICLDGVC